MPPEGGLAGSSSVSCELAGRGGGAWTAAPGACVLVLVGVGFARWGTVQLVTAMLPAEELDRRVCVYTYIYIYIYIYIFIHRNTIHVDMFKVGISPSSSATGIMFEIQCVYVCAWVCGCVGMCVAET